MRQGVDMTEAARAEVHVVVRRTAHATDGQGNSYGILDVSPDADDPAVLLAVRVGATGERFGVSLRPGGRIASHGLDLAVSELSLRPRARLLLDGTVPAIAEDDS